MKPSKERRLQILERINDLFIEEATGKNVDEELRECGRLLGWHERPDFIPPIIETDDYIDGIELARENGVPLSVYKNRIRRGKSPVRAATDPYTQKQPSDRIKRMHSRYIKVARKNGISQNLFWTRKARGWTNAQAATLPLGTRLAPKRQKK